MALRVQVVPVADGVWRIASRRVNCYLVRDGSSVTLVDSGLPAHWDGITAACRAVGLDASAIEAVLLTHVHADHAGTAERARGDRREVVRLHPEDAALCDGRTRRRTERGLTAYLWRPATVATLVELVRGGALRMRGVTSWAPVHDGEVLDVPGRPGVVHVPGHTRGSVAFVLPDRDICFTGDALVTWDLLTGRRGPRLLGRGFTEDSTAALASLDRLTALPTTVLLPGHGEPWHGAMGDAVDRARAAGPS